MRYELKYIDPWSVIKIVFLLSFLLGAVIGIFYAILLVLINNLFQNLAGDELDWAFESIRGLSLFFIILFFAIFSSIIHSLFCTIFIGIYNIIARWIGGIKVDFISVHSEEKRKTLSNVMGEFQKDSV